MQECLTIRFCCLIYDAHPFPYSVLGVSSTVNEIQQIKNNSASTTRQCFAQSRLKDAVALQQLQRLLFLCCKSAVRWVIKSIGMSLKQVVGATGRLLFN